MTTRYCDACREECSIKRSAACIEPTGTWWDLCDLCHQKLLAIFENHSWKPSKRQ